MAFFIPDKLTCCRLPKLNENVNVMKHRKIKSAPAIDWTAPENWSHPETRKKGG